MPNLETGTRYIMPQRLGQLFCRVIYLSSFHSLSSAMANQLRRDLTERHISMIAFSAQFGFGITIRSGTMLSLAGPGGALIIYAVSCFLGWALMGPFVEMSSVIPATGPVWELPALFIDTTLGGTLGYMFWFMYLVIYAEEVSVTARLFGFDYKGEPRLSWNRTKGVNSGIWALLTIITSCGVNVLPVRYYGELEYWFGYLKILGLVVIIAAQVPINLHGKVMDGPGSTGDRCENSYSRRVDQLSDWVKIGTTAEIRTAQTPPVLLTAFSESAKSRICIHTLVQRQG